MAKFFFSKGSKKAPTTRSQSLGVLWLSAGLLLVAGAAFFSVRRTSTWGEKVVDHAADSTKLALHEDSVYRSRRHGKHPPQPHSGNTTGRHRQRAAAPCPVGNDSTATYGHAARRQPLVVDLNRADTLTLQLLHGIGPVYARRIVRYRERLGGYVDLRQLLEVDGITPELVAAIAPMLTLDSGAIRRIDVNHATLKELARHPYMEYYQARDIVRLRQGGIRFASTDALRAVPSMADSTLRRLAPYLHFGDSVQ